MALGAERRGVFWLILREALLLTTAGVAVGLPMIFAVTRLARRCYSGLSPTDPVSLTLAVLLMLVVAMLGGYCRHAGPRAWTDGGAAFRVVPETAFRKRSD